MTRVIGGNQTALPIVGVMGSGGHADVDRCTPLGRWLAREGVHLLTGGGEGVMKAVSEAFREVADRKGLVIGVLRASESDVTRLAPGYPNPFVELAIRTHLPLSGSEGTDVRSRNHINVLTSDVIIALPGGEGTRSEVELCLRYQKPLVAYLKSRAEIPRLPDSVHVCANLASVQAFVRNALSEHSLTPW